jgi:hypothetical protein
LVLEPLEEVIAELEEGVMWAHVDLGPLVNVEGEGDMDIDNLLLRFF